MWTLLALPSRPVQALNSSGRVHAKGLIGPKRRIDAKRLFVRGEGLVMGEVVAGIVGGAKREHAEAAENPARGQVAAVQNRIGAIPDGTGVTAIEQLVNAEVALQLECVQ